MSVDESAQCTASDEVLLLDLFGESDRVSESISTTPAYDDALADFQMDLDAFDELIASSEQESSLLLHIEAPPEGLYESAANNEQIYDMNAVGDYISGDESSSGASSSSTGGGDAAVPTAKKPKCAPGGNAARKRQRDEVHALRESTVLLEKELQTLQAIARRSSSLPHTSSTGRSEEGRRGPDTLSPDQKQSSKGSLPPPPQTTIKTLLANEKEARQISQLKNNQLSKLVNDHVAVAQQFEKALFNRRLSVSSEAFVKSIPTSARSERMDSEPHTASDLLTFATLGKNIETQYLDLERMFRAIGLADCRTNLAEIRVNADHEADGVTLKFKFSQLIPFSIQNINELTLKNVARRPGAEHGNWKSEPFNKEFQSGDTTVTMRNVAKRYSENGRVVMVWEGLSEWLDKESGEIVTFQEKGWSVIQPYTQSSSAKKRQQQQQDTSSPLSLFQTYVCMTPGPTKRGATNRIKSRVAHFAVLSDVVKPLYETQFVARIQDLENALLDDSLARQQLAAS